MPSSWLPASTGPVAGGPQPLGAWLGPSEHMTRTPQQPGAAVLDSRSPSREQAHRGAGRPLPSSAPWPRPLAQALWAWAQPYASCRPSARLPGPRQAVLGVQERCLPDPRDSSRTQLPHRSHCGHGDASGGWGSPCACPAPGRWSLGHSSQLAVQKGGGPWVQGTVPTSLGGGWHTRG